MLATSIQEVVINQCNDQTGELVGYVKTRSVNYALIQNEDVGFQFVFQNRIVNLFDIINEDLFHILRASYHKILFEDIVEIKVKTDIKI